MFSYMSESMNAVHTAQHCQHNINIIAIYN